MKVQTGQEKYKLSLIKPHIILWKIWSKELWIWLSGAVPRKSVLWVRYRIRRTRNRTLDGEVIKKRKLRNQRDERNKNDEDDEESGKWRKWRCVFIKVANIHFNTSGKFTFKSNSFYCNLVLNCNLVSKLIPNLN